MLIISQWKLLFWSKKIFCLQKYSMPANNGCYCRHSTSHETCALHTHFRSQPSLAPLSCPSKTSYTGVKKKKAYNYIWLSSSAGVLSKTFFIPQPTTPENIWSRDKTYVVNAQLFQWVIHRFPPAARSALHPGTHPALPWNAWFTGIARIKGAARAGDATATSATALPLRSPQRTAAKAAPLPQGSRSN